MSTQPLIVDMQLPTYDAALAAHRLVDADPTATFAAARGLDFLTVRTPLLAAAMWVRGLPDRLRGRAPAPLPRLTLADEIDLPGWLSLGAREDSEEDSEIAFGAVGKFWQPSIEWRDVPPAGFAGFDEPGWGKIACNFTVRPYGPDRTLLTYECRTATTDAESRRRFGRYWWLIRPFVAHIMRATVATIAANAERSQIAQPDTSRGHGELRRRPMTEGPDHDGGDDHDTARPYAGVYGRAGRHGPPAGGHRHP